MIIFALVKCEECYNEYLLAFSCKCRHKTSCIQNSLHLQVTLSIRIWTITIITAMKMTIHSYLLKSSA